MVYAANNGNRTFNGVSFKTIGPELQKLKRKQRILYPQHVVDAARATDAPLHNCFTWDDFECGERIRREEAGRLIAAVVVYQNDKAEQAKPMFARVYLRQDKVGYVDPKLIFEHTDLYLSNVRKAQEKLSSLCREVNELRIYASTQGNGKYRPYLPQLDQAAELMLNAHESLVKIAEQEKVA